MTGTHRALLASSIASGLSPYILLVINVGEYQLLEVTAKGSRISKERDLDVQLSMSAN
jgi:hypothetical protein